VAPLGVLTVTFLGAVSDALAGMVSVAVTVVEFHCHKVVTVVAPPTPAPPETFTAVAPLRLVPVRVTETLVPWVPVIGEIEVNVGPWTANITALVVPNGVLTVTFLVVVSEAVTGMVKVAVTVVGVHCHKIADGDGSSGSGSSRDVHCLPWHRLDSCRLGSPER